MDCLHCYSGKMEVPESGHPGYVMCHTCGAIELTYEPMPYQDEFHSNPYRYNDDGTIRTQVVGAFGGYGSGKSRTTLAEVFIRALENPKGTGLLTAPTLSQLKKTTLKTLFNEVIPPQLIERYNKSDGELELVNGFVFYIIPSDEETKLRSINAGIVHLEEASGIDRTIYDQLLTRMRDPFVKNKLFVVCSNPDSGWIKTVLYDNDKRQNRLHPEHEDYNADIRCFIWRTELNQYLPQDFIELNSKGKPEWWKKKFLMGSMEHSEGMVYPNFSTTVIDPPADFAEKSKGWEKFVTLDHGLRNPTAVNFYAIDPINGIVHQYDEYYQANTLVPQHAEALKPRIAAIPSGLLRFMVADPSTKNKTDPINGKSVQALYAEYDLFFQPGNNSIEAGILRVNSYIERGKLKIHRHCVNTIKEGLNYKFPEVTMDDDKNLDEKPVKRDDHSMDSMRYGFMRLPENPDDLINIAYAPPDKYGKISKQELDEDDYDNEYGDKNDFLSYV